MRRRVRAVAKQWVLKTDIQSFILKELPELSIRQAHDLAELFNEGKEVAFIARYRGYVHGGLAPERIRKGLHAFNDAIKLNDKVHSSLSTVVDKIVGVEEQKTVKQRLLQVHDSDEHADIVKEYAPGAKKNKAQIARELGLEKYAESVLAGEFVDSNLLPKNNSSPHSVKELLEHCLADLINRDSGVRAKASDIFTLKTDCSLTVSSKLTKEAANKVREMEDSKSQLTDKNFVKAYQNIEHLVERKWSASSSSSTKSASKSGKARKENNLKAEASIRNQTVSALIKASEEDILIWEVLVKKEDLKKRHPFVNKKVHPKMNELFQKALNISIEHYFQPMICKGVERHLTRKAGDRSIQIFGQNVEQLFDRQGIKNRYVIALDPGSIVKAAFLDPTGAVKGTDEFGFRNDTTFNEYGTATLKYWALQTKNTNIVFAIGNGHNTYNTQCAVARMISNGSFPNRIDVAFCVVFEHGASKYSCTQAAREEFKDGTDIKRISAVSIGRRLICPMSEYVKIPSQHLGKGQYQLSINEVELKNKLDGVVRDRVSMNGVDVNVASHRLLSNVVGLDEEKALEIIKYRERKTIRSREELKNVKGIDPETFQQCAGFLTVSCPSSNQFDKTCVHPEDYEVAERLLRKLNTTISELKPTYGTNSDNKNTMRFILRDAIFGHKEARVKLTEKEKDVLDLLTANTDLKPPPPLLKNVRPLDQHKKGQVYTGTVVNQTDMGIFVDIGVEDDGLIPIRSLPGKLPGWNPSNLDEADIDVSVGDQLDVVVVEVRGIKTDLRLKSTPEEHLSRQKGGRRRFG